MSLACPGGESSVPKLGAVESRQFSVALAVLRPAAGCRSKVRNATAELYHVLSELVLRDIWSIANVVLQKTLDERIKSKHTFRRKCDGLGQCVVRLLGAAAARELLAVPADVTVSIAHALGPSLELHLQYQCPLSGNAFASPFKYTRDRPHRTHRGTALRRFPVAHVRAGNPSSGDFSIELLPAKKKGVSAGDCCVEASKDASLELAWTRRGSVYNAAPQQIAQLTLVQLKEVTAFAQYYCSAAENWLGDFWSYRTVLSDLARRGAALGAQGHGLSSSDEVVCSGASSGKREHVAHGQLSAKAILGLGSNVEVSGIKVQGPRRDEKHSSAEGTPCGGETAFLADPTTAEAPAASSRPFSEPPTLPTHVDGSPSCKRGRSLSQPAAGSDSGRLSAVLGRSVISLAELNDLSVLEFGTGKTRETGRWQPVPRANGAKKVAVQLSGSSARSTQSSVVNEQSSGREEELQGVGIATAAGGEVDDEYAIVTGAKELEEICHAVHRESLKLQELVAFYEDFAAECLNRRGFVAPSDAAGG